MNTVILDGRQVRETLFPKLINRIKALSFAPNLTIIQIGDRPDSTMYIQAKKRFAERIGVNVRVLNFPAEIGQDRLVAEIKQLNGDEDVHGIIIQLPLSHGLDRRTVIDAIEPKKDVDALTSARMKAWSNGQGIFPATARGVGELLDYYKIDLTDKKVTVIGRSELVGKPVALICKKRGAHVTVCHSQTTDLRAETVAADVIISAVGKPGLIDKRHVKEGQIVIDIGISKIDKVGLVGDVDFAAVKEIVGAITPVPGGVGQMTVLALFENLVDLCDVLSSDEICDNVFV